METPISLRYSINSKFQSEQFLRPPSPHHHHPHQHTHISIFPRVAVFCPVGSLTLELIKLASPLHQVCSGLFKIY